MRRMPYLAAWLLCLAAQGCGYHTSGHNSQLPANLKTIAIPAFLNTSRSYRIEQLFTGAVAQEFLTRTHYTVVHEQEQGADAILRGAILNAISTPATYDSKTGRAASVSVTVYAKVTLIGRDGKVLYDNPSYIFHDQYQLSNDLSTFFEEDTPTLQRMSRDFARTLVSNILEGF
jgi:outer membrane lipopolysaccharide assembly protein LptE/RlpB